MFCPSCADEFRDGVDRCPDCHTDLVSEVEVPRTALGELPAHSEETMELFWTADAQFLVDAASLLSAAFIPFSSEDAESLNPQARSRSSHSQPMAARLLVPADRFEEARAILDAHGMDPAASRLPQPESRESRHRRKRRAPARHRRQRQGFFWSILRGLGRGATFVLRIVGLALDFVLNILMAVG